MNMPELSAEEAIGFTNHALENNLLSTIPHTAAPFLAGMLVTLAEIANSACTCDGCQRIREITENMHEQ